MAGDFWRSSNPLVKRGRISHEGLERLAEEVHSGKYPSVKEINEFFDKNKPSDYNMTRAQWEGFRKHAINDALHEYGRNPQLPYSPLETLLYFAGKDSTGSSKILAKYQDAAGGIVLGSMLLGGIGSAFLQYDYAVSLFTHLVQNAVIEVQNEGFGVAAAEAMAADLRQIGNETFIGGPALSQIAPIMPITTLVITVRSVFKHIRHWFLQD